MLKAIDKIINKAKFKFEYIDLGGGMGISYEKNQKKLDYKKYKSAIEKFLRKISDKNLTNNQIICHQIIQFFEETLEREERVLI